MAHEAQKQFCEYVKNKYPEHFQNKKSLDVGSYDVNGNNRYLFQNCEYTGVDITAGPNVDLICKGHEIPYQPETFETIISTEALEHDMYYPQTLRKIIELLKSGGLFLFTCATTGRAEHGTKRAAPDAAPGVVACEEWAYYYKNLTETDIREAIFIDEIFKTYEFQKNVVACDLYFCGIKK